MCSTIRPQNTNISKKKKFSSPIPFDAALQSFPNIRSKRIREWVLTKVVNGERASYSAPKFARMQERTRSQMLEDIVANLANHAETGQIPKPYRRGSWRPIGEDPCMLRVTVSCCMRLYVPHSMYLKHSLAFLLCIFDMVTSYLLWTIDHFS